MLFVSILCLLEKAYVRGIYLCLVESFGVRPTSLQGSLEWSKYRLTDVYTTTYALATICFCVDTSQDSRRIGKYGPIGPKQAQ